MTDTIDAPKVDYAREQAAAQLSCIREALEAIAAAVDWLTSGQPETIIRDSRRMTAAINRRRAEAAR